MTADQGQRANAFADIIGVTVKETAVDRGGLNTDRWTASSTAFLIRRKV
jgi:hypothetical protein